MKRALFYIFLFLSVLLILDCTLYYFYLVSFAGYYTDVSLFWLWFALSIIVIVVYWKKIVAKLFLCGIILALVGSILPMALLFFSFILSMSSYGLTMDKNLDSKYRVQIVGYSVMAHPWLEVIEKRGLFEQRKYRCTEIDLSDDFDLIKYEVQLRPAVKIKDAKDIVLDSDTDSTLNLLLIYDNFSKRLTFDKFTSSLVGNEIIE